MDGKSVYVTMDAEAFRRASCTSPTGSEDGDIAWMNNGGALLTPMHNPIAFPNFFGVLDEIDITWMHDWAQVLSPRQCVPGRPVIGPGFFGVFDGPMEGNLRSWDAVPVPAKRSGKTIRRRVCHAYPVPKRLPMTDATDASPAAKRHCVYPPVIWSTTRPVFIENRVENAGFWDVLSAKVRTRNALYEDKVLPRKDVAFPRREKHEPHTDEYTRTSPAVNVAMLRHVRDIASEHVSVLNIGDIMDAVVWDLRREEIRRRRNAQIAHARLSTIREESEPPTPRRAQAPGPAQIPGPVQTPGQTQTPGLVRTPDSVQTPGPVHSDTRSGRQWRRWSPIRRCTKSVGSSPGRDRTKQTEASPIPPSPARLLFSDRDVYPSPVKAETPLSTEDPLPVFTAEPEPIIPSTIEVQRQQSACVQRSRRRSDGRLSLASQAKISAIDEEVTASSLEAIMDGSCVETADEELEKSVVEQTKSRDLRLVNIDFAQMIHRRLSEPGRVMSTPEYLVDARKNLDIFLNKGVDAIRSMAAAADVVKDMSDSKVIVEKNDEGRLFVRFKLPAKFAHVFANSYATTPSLVRTTEEASKESGTKPSAEVHEKDISRITNDDGDHTLDVPETPTPAPSFEPVTPHITIAQADEVEHSLPATSATPTPEVDNADVSSRSMNTDRLDSGLSDLPTPVDRNLETPQQAPDTDNTHMSTNTDELVAGIADTPTRIVLGGSPSTLEEGSVYPSSPTGQFVDSFMPDDANEFTEELVTPNRGVQVTHTDLSEGGSSPVYTPVVDQTMAVDIPSSWIAQPSSDPPENDLVSNEDQSSTHVPGPDTARDEPVHTWKNLASTTSPVGSDIAQDEPVDMNENGDLNSSPVSGLDTTHDKPIEGQTSSKSSTVGDEDAIETDPTVTASSPHYISEEQATDDKKASEKASPDSPISPNIDASDKVALDEVLSREIDSFTSPASERYGAITEQTNESNAVGTSTKEYPETAIDEESTKSAPTADAHEDGQVSSRIATPNVEPPSSASEGHVGTIGQNDNSMATIGAAIKDFFSSDDEAVNKAAPVADTHEDGQAEKAQSLETETPTSPANEVRVQPEKGEMNAPASPASEQRAQADHEQGDDCSASAETIAKDSPIDCDKLSTHAATTANAHDDGLTTDDISPGLGDCPSPAAANRPEDETERASEHNVLSPHPKASKGSIAGDNEEKPSTTAPTTSSTEGNTQSFIDQQLMLEATIDHPSTSETPSKPHNIAIESVITPPPKEAQTSPNTFESLLKSPFAPSCAGTPTRLTSASPSRALELNVPSEPREMLGGAAPRSPDLAEAQEAADRAYLDKFLNQHKASKAARTAIQGSSLLSRATSTGSPKPRTPLGYIDANTASPTKASAKRKADNGEEEADVGKPPSKRGRKGSALKPKMEDEAPLRRSSRVKAKTQENPTEANSKIPIRVGSGVFDGPAAGGETMEADLASVTRANTRRNKGKAMAPAEVLARQRQDPASRKMQELKEIHDARAARAGKVAKKGVQWGENEEVIYQAEEEDDENVEADKEAPAKKKGGRAKKTEPKTTGRRKATEPRTTTKPAGVKKTTRAKPATPIKRQTRSSTRRDRETRAGI